MTEIEIAYRSLAVFLSTHFMGEPKADDLRGLLNDAREFHRDMSAAIEQAEKAMASLPEGQNIHQGYTKTPPDKPEGEQK